MSEILSTFSELRQWNNDYGEWLANIPFTAETKSGWICRGESLMKKLEELGVDYELMADVDYRLTMSKKESS